MGGRGGGGENMCADVLPDYSVTFMNYTDSDSPIFQLAENGYLINIFSINRVFEIS